MSQLFIKPTNLSSFFLLSYHIIFNSSSFFSSSSFCLDYGRLPGTFYEEQMGFKKVIVIVIVPIISKRYNVVVSLGQMVKYVLIGQEYN